MLELEIRPARADDAEAACAAMRRSIVELCAADHGHDPHILAGWLANKTTANVAMWISDRGNFVYVAINGGKIAGVAAMTQTGLITLNYVSPEARFRGVSKMLLAALERKAADLGLAQCGLTSTKTALRFYRAAGYVERRTGDEDSGITMIKEIASATTR